MMYNEFYVKGRFEIQIKQVEQNNITQHKDPQALFCMILIVDRLINKLLFQGFQI